MKRTTLMASIAAIAVLGWGFEALAGNNLPTGKAKAFPAKQATVDKRDSSVLQPTDGWEYIGGESMRGLAQHKYVFTDGILAHASDCTLRMAANSGSPALTGPVYQSPGG